MGKFIYEGGIRAEFDDRALSHLQVAIGTKLRRNEPFYFTWHGDVSTGGGRPAKINRTWLEALMRTANSPVGLQVVAEPPDEGGSEMLG